MNQKTICFTGHIPQKLFGYNPYASGNLELLLTLRKVIEEKIENGTTTFITGMALGINMWAARIVLTLKKIEPVHPIDCIRTLFKSQLKLDK